MNLNQEPKQPESIEEKINKLRGRKRELLQKDVLGFSEEANEFAARIIDDYKARGEDARKYKTLHMLIGSTTDDNFSPYYDFPEPEYSIEKFIERKEKEEAEKK